jgi:Uma2 family endonuclease
MPTVDQWIRQAPAAVRDRFEYIDRRWSEREVTGWDHQTTADDLIVLFKGRGLRVTGGVRVLLPLPELDKVVPDVLVVSRTNPAQPGPGHYAGVPDLVVEVLAADYDYDHGEDTVKKDRYAAAGVRHYWLVCLKWGTLEASELRADGRYHQTSAGSLQPLGALPVPPDLR